jgi:fumarate hydratase class II
VSEFRIEKDSMGEVQVPANAYYQAQTQRAVDNFPISGITLKNSLIKALGLIKKNAALANLELKLIEENTAKLIVEVCDEIIEGKLNDQFPIDIFQTGSGTSSNMNTNEVVSTRANELAKEKNIDTFVHPNDHVNFGQSSNDVFPTALRIAAAIESKDKLLGQLETLKNSLLAKGKEYAHVVKTGKTHLMDAMPVSFEQVFGGYARQVELGAQRIASTFERLYELPQGGTAVGTGINTHPEFGAKFAALLAKETGVNFKEAVNHFEAQAALDAPHELSAQLKTFACSLMKIANDFRWMNSGPNSGISEVKLKALQPGSSIMPGKVNPVIEESVCMVCAQVIGNDTAIAIGAQSGNFELNVMFPMVANNLMESIEILGNACENFAKRSIDGLIVNEKNIEQKVSKNPILVTALNPIIGYDLAAKIAKTAYAEDRALLDVAKEMCDVPEAELKKALDPKAMTQGGFNS